MAACPADGGAIGGAFSFPEQDLPQHPTHTPYDGSSKLFTIGLRPLDFANSIEIDDAFDFQLAEKRRIHAEHAAQVFVAEAGSEDAQAEVLALLEEHLPARFPERYRRDR